MNLKDFFQSKLFKRILCGVGTVVVLLVVFQAGMYVGFRKANFSYKWGENYHRNFGGPRGGFFGDFKGEDFTGANGVAGQIIKIDAQKLTVKGSDNVEKIVLIKADTTINKLRGTIKLADLKVNDYVVAIGEPNNLGQIEAKLIRLMPPPPPARSAFMPEPSGLFSRENFKR